MEEGNLEERLQRERQELRSAEEAELREEQEERREERELRRSLTRKLAEYLGFADLIAVLMVAATAFTAFATWRTATIARDLLMSSERPYFGVHGVTLDRDHSGDPRIYVDYRNFGHVPADDVRLQVTMFVDGQPLAADSVTRNAGIMSPEVPHVLFLHLPKDRYADMMAGHTKLLVQISSWYRSSSRRQFCYRERFAYVPDSGTFEIAGGSSRCDSTPPVEP